MSVRTGEFRIMLLDYFNFPKLWSNITDSENIKTIIIFVGVIVALFLSAIQAERIINRAKGETVKKEFKTQRMTIVAMLSALAVILNVLSFSLPFFVPSFYKFDFSDFPAIIGAFALGPVAGVVIQTVKTLLNIVINGTITGFIGEFALFMIGSTFVIPASLVYYFKRTKKSAYIGLWISVAIVVIVGCLMNEFVLLPAYTAMMPMDAIIGMGTKINPAITGMGTFILFATAPFNLVKYAVVTVITMFTYKPISRLITSVRNKQG